MQSTSPPANFIDAFANGLGQALAPGLEAVAYLILGVMIASPALASIALLWLEPHVGVLRRLKIANGIAGVLLTILSAYLIAWGMFALSVTTQWILPFAVILAALALGLQWTARMSFTGARATGVACAVLTPLTLVALDAIV